MMNRWLSKIAFCPAFALTACNSSLLEINRASERERAICLYDNRQINGGSIMERDAGIKVCNRQYHIYRSCLLMEKDDC